jgi:hypothetical protein
MFPARFVVMFLMSFCALISHHAEAVQRTHVSAAFGNDANTASNCTATAPCRFFQAAMTVTDTNGEVIVLDSGGYGAVTITKSLALIAPAGVYAGISVFPGTAGVLISTPGINVVLRGLTINGQGGSFGVYTSVAGNLSIFNCEISNFSTNPTDAAVFATNNAKLRIVDSVIRDSFYGARIVDGAKASFSKVSVLGSTSIGIYASSSTAGVTTTVAVSESILSDNTIGVYVYSTVANALARGSVIRTSVTGGNYGIYSQGINGLASSVALITVSESMVTGAAVYGLVQAGTGAILRSLGNNTVDQNNVNSSGTISFSPTV